MILQLNKIQYPVYNLGPGKRLGIWVQGCSIHCKGCINRSAWAKKQGRKMHVLDIYNLIELICKDYDGITITGGEPFNQYPSLMALAMLLKRKTSLNILCYTGYRLEELEQKYPERAFYNCIDYLIDGRYEKDLISSDSLKGSENQHIYKLYNNKALNTELKPAKKTWSLNCGSDNIYMAGIPAQHEMKIVKAKMKQSGVNLKLV